MPTARVFTGLVLATSAACLPLAGTAAATPTVPPTPPPQLMINGGEPISKANDDTVYAYARCAGNSQPGPLVSDQLGTPEGWYQLEDGNGHWAKLAVINAAQPGTYNTSTTCGDGSTAEATYTII